MKLYNLICGIFAAFSFAMGIVTVAIQPAKTTLVNDKLFAGFFVLGCLWSILFLYTTRLMQPKHPFSK